MSAALNLAWLLPARDAATHTWLGWWLLPLLTLCLAGALYAIFAVHPAADPAGQAVKNALSAAGVTVWLLSLWYLVNPEFADFFAFTAYGREEPFLAFGKYFREIVVEQMGILLALGLPGGAPGLVVAAARPSTPGAAAPERHGVGAAAVGRRGLFHLFVPRDPGPFPLRHAPAPGLWGVDCRRAEPVAASLAAGHCGDRRRAHWPARSLPLISFDELAALRAPLRALCGGPARSTCWPTVSLSSSRPANAPIPAMPQRRRC